jgi:ABC-type uncharacterized transport system substrate-binding protein
MQGSEKQRSHPALNTPVTIGILHSGTSGKGKNDRHIQALLDVLENAGYDESGKNKNISIKPKSFAQDDPNQLTQLASDLITIHKVQLVIAAGGTASAQAAMKATNQTPIVYTSITSRKILATNATGVCARTSELDPLRLCLLAELLPSETNLGALYNPSRTNSTNLISDLKAQAAALNVNLDPQPVSGGNNQTTIVNNIKQTFSKWKGHLAGVVVTADPVFNDLRDDVIGAAANNNIRAIYQWDEFADAGGLMSYGTNIQKAYELAGTYVASILDHGLPSNLASFRPAVLTRDELVINLGIASKIGLSIPQTLLARADRIIP